MPCIKIAKRCYIKTWYDCSSSYYPSSDYFYYLLISSSSASTHYPSGSLPLPMILVRLVAFFHYLFLLQITILSFRPPFVLFLFYIMLDCFNFDNLQWFYSPDWNVLLCIYHTRCIGKIILLNSASHSNCAPHLIHGESVDA